MLDAAKKAVEALKAYVDAEEVSSDLAGQLVTATEGLLQAASRQDWDVAMVYDAYIAWLGED